MKIKIDPSQNPHEPRRNILFSTKSGTYRICGYDMLPQKMDSDGTGYTRIPWEQFRQVVTS
jgi:hypothetical protein